MTPKVTNYKYRKLLSANRNYLQGSKFFKALEALEFGRSYHNGKWKDGSAEFSHQLSIGLYIRSISAQLQFPKLTFAAVYLHDVSEDYPVSNQEIQDRFGKKVARIVELLDKNRLSRRMSKKEYYSPMSLCPVTSIIKGADRMHNFETMGSVFTKEKQIAYMNECRLYILPMLKQAYYNFPKQYMAYDNLRHVLKMQIQMICKINGIPSMV